MAIQATVQTIVITEEAILLQLRCDPCGTATPHTMVELSYADATGFTCQTCGEMTVLG